MILTKELNDLVQFMAQSGKKLGLSEENLDQIGVKASANIQFTFPSHTSQLELIRQITKEVASYVPEFDEDDLDDIGLAIDEACANVITHSYQEGQEQGAIEAQFTIESDKFTIVIIDEGERGQMFSLDQLSNVDKDEYLRKLTKGGLGVHLIKKIMDEVEYTVSPGKYNCLSMVKLVPK